MSYISLQTGTFLPLRWRTYTVAYWIATTPIGIPRDGRNVLMWHDNLWMIRHLLFLVLPIAIHALPQSPPPPNPVPHLALARASLQNTSQQLASARFVHAAAERQPALRAAAAEWWERQHVEGEWARTDEHVRRAAEKLGKGMQEGVDGPAGKLSRVAKDAVRQMFESLGLGVSRRS